MISQWIFNGLAGRIGFPNGNQFWQRLGEALPYLLVTAWHPWCAWRALSQNGLVHHEGLLEPEGTGRCTAVLKPRIVNFNRVILAAQNWQASWLVR